MWLSHGEKYHDGFPDAHVSYSVTLHTSER